MEKRGFNLVEVTLAMGVLAFGMTGVFSMTMAGMKNARDTIGETYAVMVAEHIYGAVQTAAEDADYFAYGTDNQGIQVEDVDMSEGSGAVVIERQSIGFLDQTMSNKSIKAEKMSESDEYEFMKLGNGSKAGRQAGAWRCRLKTFALNDNGEPLKDKASERVDFTADVRVWLAGSGSPGSGSPVSYMYPWRDENGNVSFRKDHVYWDWFVPGDEALAGMSFDKCPSSQVGVFVEVTWPVDRDLVNSKGLFQRNRRVFYREVFR